MSFWAGFDLAPSGVCGVGLRVPGGVLPDVLGSIVIRFLLMVLRVHILPAEWSLIVSAGVFSLLSKTLAAVGFGSGGRFVVC